MELYLDKNNNPILKYYRGKKEIERKLSLEEIDLIVNKEGKLKNRQWVDQIIKNNFKKPSLKRKLFLKSKKSLAMNNELRKRKVDELRERKKKLEEMKNKEEEKEKITKIDNELKLINAAIQEFNNNGDVSFVDSVVTALSTNVANLNISNEVLEKLLKENKIEFKNDELKKELENLKEELKELKGKKDVLEESESDPIDIEPIKEEIDKKEDEIMELKKKIETISEQIEYMDKKKISKEDVEKFVNSTVYKKIDELEKGMNQKITIEDLNELYADIASMRNYLDSFGDDILKKGDISEIEELKTINTRIEEVVKTAMEKQNDVHKVEMEEISNGITDYKIELSNLWDGYKKETDKNIKKELKKAIEEKEKEINEFKEFQKKAIEEEKNNLEKLIKEGIEISKNQISTQLLANEALRKEVEIYKSKEFNRETREEAYNNILLELEKYFFSVLLPKRFIINGIQAKITNEEIYNLLSNNKSSDEVFRMKIGMKIGIEVINVNIINNIACMINNDDKREKQIWFIQYYDAFIVVSKNIDLDEVSNVKDFFGVGKKPGLLTSGKYSESSSGVYYINKENKMKIWDENGKDSDLFVVNIGGQRKFKGETLNHKPDFEDDEVITYKDLGDSNSVNVVNMMRNFDSDTIEIKEVGDGFNIVTNNLFVNEDIEQQGKNMKECMDIFLKHKDMTIFDLFDFDVGKELEKINIKNIGEKTEEKSSGVCGEILDKLSKELQKYRVGFNLYISPK